MCRAWVSLWDIASGLSSCLFNPGFILDEGRDMGAEAGGVVRILNGACSLFFAWEMPVLWGKRRTKLIKY